MTTDEVTVDPALAGMLRAWNSSGSAARSRPRARGDAPPQDTTPRAWQSSTPRLRGCSEGPRDLVGAG
uniref:hypothetical protein n=1 Tax=Streptomyces spororaveus TaxID=284039 RepID=UPI001F35E7E2